MLKKNSMSRRNLRVFEVDLIFQTAHVGMVVVPLQTPRAVTVEPSSLEILPPLVAVVIEMDDETTLIRVGTEQTSVVWVMVKGNEFPQVLYAQTYHM